MRASLKIVAPNLPILGCWFHFAQPLRRKINPLFFIALPMWQIGKKFGVTMKKWVQIREKDTLTAYTKWPNIVQVSYILHENCIGKFNFQDVIPGATTVVHTHSMNAKDASKIWTGTFGCPKDIFFAVVSKKGRGCDFWTAFRRGHCNHRQHQPPIRSFEKEL